MFDLLIKGAHVVDPLNGVNGSVDVAVTDGKIAAVGRDLAGDAKEVLDFTGFVLQPGIIDSHVHLGSMWGSPYGARMLAMKGVTTCLDMAGPLEDVLDHVLPQHGAGINTAILQFASPPFTFKTDHPTKGEMEALIEKSLENGALGVKLLGGHYPLKPDVSSLLIRTALERRAYVAWHAGTSEHGSNIEGMQEAVAMADGCPLHLAHINAYCRGAIRSELEETAIAIDLLKKNPNVFCESYVSPKNGTRLTCDKGKIQSKVTGNCLRKFGFSEDRDGVRKAILAGKAFVVYDAGGYSDLVTGEAGLKLWEDADSDVGGSFNVNPPLPRIWLAEAKRDDGSFVVDAISTDGGCIPRNVILSQGLSLVKLDILSLAEFAQKTSLNPARMLRLAQKGHLSVGADADITIYDYATQEPKATFVAGRKVLWDGQVVGSGATIICTERGKDAIEKRGMKAVVVDPGEPVKRVKAL